MRQYSAEDFMTNRLYLEALAQQYPTVQAAAAEIINLRAILGLPKGTEHFLSDIHGEYETFRHILNNASGAIREKVDILFADTLTAKERAQLATVIYYPKRKLNALLPTIENKDEFYRLTILRLLAVCRLLSSKYTKSRVRKSIPTDYAYILVELIYENQSVASRTRYREKILDSIIELEQAEAVIIALSETIKRLAVAHLHIVGDLFDRGPRPDIVIEDLMKCPVVDIQWGNHDILWMGAAAGSRTCIANALNNAFSYGNLDTIEMGYGISLRPLALFANEVYGQSDVTCFMPKGGYLSSTTYSANAPETVARMHKAIAVILFKLEGQVIRRHPEFKMEDRMLLDKVNFSDGTIVIEGKTYSLKDWDMPTVQADDPYRLSEQETEVMEQLKNAFRHSEKLQRHINFIFSKGSLYKCYNNNLLFHGSIPMNEDGSLMAFTIEGVSLAGRPLLDALEIIARQGYYAPNGTEEKSFGKDMMWFLWCGKNSPLFGRQKMTTFEHLLIDDPALHEEPRNAYYQLYEDEARCVALLREFGLFGTHSHIINGHIPVRVSKNESPIKANGRLIVIDGGFCKAYFGKTGIAGYTLVYGSYGMRIIAHEPFAGVADAIENNRDILSTTAVFDAVQERISVSETDTGDTIRSQIDGLTMLLQAYQNGFLNPR